MRILLAILLLTVSTNVYAFSRHFKTEDEARAYIHKNHNSGSCIELIQGKRGWWIRSCK